MLTPESPERSILNCVAYDDPSSLVDAYDELVSVYDEAGVRAWTVWVPPVEGEAAVAAAALSARGHVLDGRPEGMALPLDGADLGGEDVGVPVGWDEMARLNEAAYSYPAGAFSAARAPDGPGLHILGVPGEAVAGSLEVDGTATILFVATDPAARGRGHATALMKQLLRGARSRGCDLSVLEASPMGRPVYERMGYRSVGTIEMWERRR